MIHLRHAILAAAVLSLAACTRKPADDHPPPPQTPRVAEYRDPRSPITVAPGTAFVVLLDANVTTGYHWELEQRPDSSVVAFVGREYVPYPNPGHAVGSGGTDHWTFRALRPGHTSFTLAYLPPSAGSPAERQTYDVTVRVAGGRQTDAATTGD